MSEPKSYLYHPRNIIGDVRTGDEHSWADEFKVLWSNDSRGMLALMNSVLKEGIREPVVIGADGRLWDGHHRLAVAIALQLGPIEVLDHRVPAEGERTVSETKSDEFVWPEGWASSTMGTQKKFHYYRGGKALCGKWQIFRHHLEYITLTPPADPMSIWHTSGNDCTACTRKMRADVERAKSAEEQGD